MAASKPFGDVVNSLGNALYLFNIVHSDSTDMATAVRMIYCGVGGDISLVDTYGNTTIHKNVGSGTYLGPFSVARVTVANTTATNLIGYV